MKTARTTFFTRDKNFYKTFFRLMLVVALQNLVAYSVNMLDNIMLGSYSQNALSGAATVNQIFFIVNQLALSIGNALVAICSQYWGKQETGAIRKMTGVALALSVLIGAIVVTACTCIPEQLLRIFTTSPEIIAEGKAYLGLLKWTFLLFMISNLLIAMLRSVETVKISFVISVVSLITNGCINYTLIFGHFGFPEMGIQGAAVGTLTARILELLIIVVYIWKIDTKVRLFDINLFRTIFLPENRKIWGAFFKVAFPIMCSGMIWAISVPMQTAILGHLSADAIAANSVSSTFFQYLKVIVIAISSASAVVIGKDIGEGDIERVKSEIVDNKNNKETVKKAKTDPIINMPIIILTNENTASASEILAGALKDLGKAKTVGTTTYGKGVIQQILKLSDGSGLKVTIEEYQTPNRNKIHKIGIAPDEEVKLPDSVTNVLNVTESEDTQLQKAIEMLK